MISKNTFEEFTYYSTDKGFLNIQKSARIGRIHQDTNFFDDIKFLKTNGVDIRNTKINKIKFWYGTLVPSGVCNGIQITFTDLVTNKQYVTGERKGSHQLVGSKVYEFSDNEYLSTSIMIGSGAVVDGIEFQTLSGRKIHVGGKGGDKKVINLPKDSVILGTFGGFGGHLHNVGIYYMNNKELKYHRRKDYILIREALRKGKNKISLDVLDILKDEKNKIAEYLFIKLCKDANNFVFSQVIKYII